MAVPRLRTLVRPTGIAAASCCWLALVTACTTAARGAPDFAYRKSEPPLTIAWNYRRPGLATVVAEGIARNELPRKFQFVDVWASLSGLDAQGGVVSRAVVRLPDLVGPETPFRITLSLMGTEETFALRFRYNAEDIETNGGRQ